MTFTVTLVFTGLHAVLLVSVPLHAQAVKQQQHQGLDKQQLSWQELHRAAQIAAWSGLCYLLPDELQAAIQQQHKGLNLVAAGRNGYTSW
jgi:hypothetical protein